MQEKKLFHYRLGIIVLIILQNVLAFITLSAYAVAQNVKYNYFAVLLILVLVLPLFFRKHWSPEAFFRLSIIYYAFIPTSDLVMLNNLPEKTNLFRIDFSIDASLSLLSTIPREIPGFMIFVWFFLVLRGYKWKKEYTFVIICTFILGGLLLVLPDVSEVLLYIAVYLIIQLIYVWLDKCSGVSMEKYEKVLFWILLLVVWAKGCYRMLEILEVYPFVWQNI